MPCQVWQTRELSGAQCGSFQGRPANSVTPMKFASIVYPERRQDGTLLPIKGLLVRTRAFAVATGFVR